MRTVPDIIAAAVHTEWPHRTPRVTLAEELREHDPSQVAAAAREAVGAADDWAVREAGTWALGVVEPEAAVPFLAVLAQTDDDAVRRLAFDDWLALPAHAWSFMDGATRDHPTFRQALEQALLSWDDDDRRAAVAGAEEWLATVALESQRALGWKARRDLAITLRTGTGTTSREALIRYADDSDDDARKQALTSLIAREDPAAPGLLLVGLLDAHLGVRTHARELCESAADHPLLQRIADGHQGFAWAEQPARIEALVDWAGEMCLTLLDVPAKVLPYRSGVGRTFYPKGAAEVRIDLNLDPLVIDPSRGEDVVRGVILHEIGHHRYDYRQPGFKSANGVARSLGVLPVFDILLDERLERGLRSEFPDLGEYLDQAAGFVFRGVPAVVGLAELAAATGRPAADLVRDIEGGVLPGRVGKRGGVPAVAMRSTDLLQFENLVPPLSAFLLALRGVRDRHRVADPRVREALEAVPADLRAITHGELVRLSVHIAAILGVEDDGASERSALQRLRRTAPGAADALDATLGEARAHVDQGRWALSDTPEHDGSWSRGVPSSPPPSGALPPRAAVDDPLGRSRSLANLGRELSFARLKHDKDVRDQPQRLAAIRRTIRPGIRRLRGHLDKLATREHEEMGVRSGQRLDVACARRLAVSMTPNLMVRTVEDPGADAYLGVVIDRSGSMSGARIELARRFGVLVADAASGVPGLEGHVSAFTDDTFYRMGTFRRHTIAGLEAGGGNNDSGALLRAAELAMASGKSRRLLVMISDGLPTECTFASLQALVATLERSHGILCAQVAVAPLSKVAFPHYFDLSTIQGVNAQVAAFGRVLERLTSRWR